MPDFTVIEGGGGPPEDYHTGWARHFLHSLAIELLRSLARGDDNQGRVAHDLKALAEHLSQTTTPVSRIVDDVVTGLHASISREDRSSPHEEEIYRIVKSALRVAAESFCHDNAAKGRLGQRERSLENAIEWHIGYSETRARKNGWSFLGELAKRYVR